MEHNVSQLGLLCDCFLICAVVDGREDNPYPNFYTEDCVYGAAFVIRRICQGEAVEVVYGFLVHAWLVADDVWDNIELKRPAGAVVDREL